MKGLINPKVNLWFIVSFQISDFDHYSLKMSILLCLSFYFVKFLKCSLLIVFKVLYLILCEIFHIDEKWRYERQAKNFHELTFVEKLRQATISGPKHVPKAFEKEDGYIKLFTEFCNGSFEMLGNHKNSNSTQPFSYCESAKYHFLSIIFNVQTNSSLSYGKLVGM